MRRITVVACSLLLSFACKSSEKAEPVKAPAAKAEPTSVKATEDAKKTSKACTMLTAEMVATVAKVPVDELKLQAGTDRCLYKWRKGTAGIGFIKTAKSAADARAQFENDHKNMTAAEVGAAMDKLAGEAKKGEEVAAGATKSMGGGITFESVDAVGDAAAYETTKHTNKIANAVIVNYANKIDVLTGDLRFSLSFKRHEGHDGQMYKAEAIALAQAVLSGLK